MFDVTDYATPQDAVDAAQVAGGGKVYFPAGNYAPVVVTASNIFLTGDGPASTITAVGASGVSFEGAVGAYLTNCAMRDLRILGTGTGITFQYCTDTDIENCMIQAMTGYGIDFIIHSWIINITNSWIGGNDGGGIRLRNDNIQSVHIRGSHITNNQGFGIYYQRAVGCSVLGSTIQGNDLAGIEADDVLLGLSVVGNYFELNNKLPGSEGPQVNITATGPDVAQGFVFLGNYEQGADVSTQGLYANAGEYGVVAGNCMRRHTDAPLEIVSPAAAWLVAQGRAVGTPNLPHVSAASGLRYLVPRRRWG